MKYLPVAAFWTALGLISGMQVWLSMITHGHSVPLLVGHYVIVWEGWFALTLGVVWLTRRVPIIPFTSRALLIHTFAGVIAAVLHISFWITLTLTMKPYDRMNPTWATTPFSELLFARLPVELILYLTVAGAAQAVMLERSLMNARLHALELQLQPHFLFNTLNTISSLVRAGQNSDAVTMIAGLSDLLRYTLDRAGRQRVTLEEESEMLERYLGIQQGRFPDRLSISIEVAPDVRRATVPTFILQPLAENAIRHGIARSAAAGVVNVRAFRRDAHVQIEIFNSGTIAASRVEGIGLQNTRERLRQLYGSDQHFELRAEGDGVLASILLPLQEAT